MKEFDRTCGSRDSEDLDSVDVERGLEMKTGNESDEHQNESLKTESSINITCEVDKCDLWKRKHWFIGMSVKFYIDRCIHIHVYANLYFNILVHVHRCEIV